MKKVFLLAFLCLMFVSCSDTQTTKDSTTYQQRDEKTDTPPDFPVDIRMTEETLPQWYSDTYEEEYPHNPIHVICQQKDDWMGWSGHYCVIIGTKSVKAIYQWHPMNHASGQSAGYSWEYKEDNHCTCED